MKRINLQYRVIQGLYWMLYCVCFGYMTLYLSGKGYSASGIGIIAAVFGVVSTLMQPVIGHITDKALHGWKISMLVSLAICLVLSAGLLMVDKFYVQGALFGLLIALVGAMMPLINTICFSCTEDGMGVDFGSARGVGSLGYAAISILLGHLLKEHSENIIPLVAGALIPILALLIMIIPFVPGKRNLRNGVVDERKNTFINFFHQTHGFLLIWLGGVLMMAFHCMTNTYMLQIVQKAGGGSDSLGVTLGIAAIMELPVMFAFGKISERFSLKSLFIVTGVAFITKALLYFAAENVYVIWTAQIFQMLSFALYANLTVIYAAKYVKKEFQTLGQSLMSATISIGTVAGSLLGGFLLEKIGIRGMLIVGITLSAAGLVTIILRFVTGCELQEDKIF
ncbi:MAG: MFS transporter [Lachnospiraceae bacterium]|nr:MFS transporter [Lachnospiraceae bacterium]